MGYNLQRFSPLKQINRQTVKQLAPVWNYSYDDNRAEESQPLVYNGVLYVTTHNATMAVDAKTGKQIWKTKVEYPPETPRIVCCGIINRGWRDLDGKLFRTTLDANVHRARRRRPARSCGGQNAIDYKHGYSMTVAPLVADGVVITGISGAEYGIRGFIDGWDPETGKHCGAPTPSPAPGDRAATTWPGDTWQHGGGSTWITGSYDPELNTVYWGTGNAGSVERRQPHRATTCTPARSWRSTRRPARSSGTTSSRPNDPYDYDSVAEMVLADLRSSGKPTKVLMHANRNGFFYVLDRTNGKLLAANPYVQGQLGDRHRHEDRPADRDRRSPTRCARRRGRSRSGRRSSAARTGSRCRSTRRPAWPMPTRSTSACTTSPSPASTRPAEWYLGVDLSDVWAWPDGPRGYLKAIDPMTGKAKWEAPSDMPRFSGVLSTAGGVVFSGAADRRVRGLRRRYRQEALAVPDRLRHRRPAGDLGAGRRAVRRRLGRHRRRLHAVLRRRAAGLGAGRRLALGLRGTL